MLRLFITFCALVIGIGAVAAPSAATPPSYDIFCSAGSLAKASPGTTGDVTVERLRFATQVATTENGRSVCGWFTRAWRDGEPTFLCIQPKDLAQLDAAAQSVPDRAGVTLPQIASFSVYNDSNGCMVVTGFSLGDSHAFAPSYLVCDTIFGFSPSGYAGRIRAFGFAHATGSQGVVSPGSCSSVGGAAFPPSGLVCFGEAPGATLPQGTFLLSVKPWWPCGVAQLVTGPVPGLTPPAGLTPPPIPRATAVNQGLPTPTPTPEPTPTPTPPPVPSSPVTVSVQVPVKIDVPQGSGDAPYSLACSFTDAASKTTGLARIPLLNGTVVNNRTIFAQTEDLTIQTSVTSTKISCQLVGYSGKTLAAFAAPIARPVNGEALGTPTLVYQL